MVSNWSRQTWDSATAECPQVNLTAKLTLLCSLSNASPAPWWKHWSLVSSSRVLSASIFGESPGQRPLPPQHTDHSPGSILQVARLKRSHYGPQAWSSLPPVHKHSHWTACFLTHMKPSDLTWNSTLIPFLSLLHNLAFNLQPSTSRFP